jgi:hypothetical protein
LAPNLKVGQTLKALFLAIGQPSLNNSRDAVLTQTFLLTGGVALTQLLRPEKN